VDLKGEDQVVLRR